MLATQQLPGLPTQHFEKPHVSQAATQQGRILGVQHPGSGLRPGGGCRQVGVCVPVGVDKREEESHWILLPRYYVDAMGAVGVVAGGGEQPVRPFGEFHISVAQQRIPARPAGHVHVVVDGCGAGGEEVPEGAGVECGWPVAGEEEAADVAGVGAALEECAQFGALFGVGGSVAVDEVSWLEPDNGGDDKAMGAGHPRTAKR